MAANLDIQTTGTETVLAYWVRDALKTMYTHGEDTKLDRKIEGAYEQFMGVPFDARLAARAKPYYLHGFPGHGKTTIMIKGSERVAKMLDLNLVVNPDNDYQSSKDDFVFLCQELSGEMSNIEVGGIPNKKEFKTKDGKTYEAMVKLTKPQIMAAREAGAAFILYDDVSSAGASVVNSVLSVAQFGVYQGISFGKRTLFAFTGNYGAADGTNVSRPSSALDNRCQHHYVEDTLEPWLDRVRANKNYQDEYGCGFADEFLEANPEYFHVPKEGHAEKALSSPYPSPRSWSGVLDQARDTIGYIRALENSSSATNSEFRGVVGGSWKQLEDLIRSQVGSKAVSAAVGWYQSKISEAEPLAKMLIEKGDLDKESEKKLTELGGQGISSDHVMFQNQFVNSMVDYSLKQLLAKPHDQKTRTHVMQAFFKGMWSYFPTTSATKTLGLNKLGNRLKNASDDYNKNDNLDIIFIEGVLDDLADFALSQKAAGTPIAINKALVKDSLVPAMTGSLNRNDDGKLSASKFDNI